MNRAKPLILRRTIHSILVAAACAPVVIPLQTHAAELPMVCIAGSCGAAGPSSFVSSGNATAVATGNTLTVNQSSDRAILNWASFNVSADGHVIFNQPSTSSIALNRIFQNSPSRIFGQVTANGEIYLVNPNGIVFGKTARIDAAGILASTLNIKDSVFNSGIASPNLIQSNDPAALRSDGRLSVLDADGNPIRGTIDAGGNVVVDPWGEPIKVRLTVQDGAALTTTGANGRILLAGQNVDNAGSLTSADGQVILAAGDSVFLQASDKPELRGLLVEVGVGGEVWNRVTGQISTPRGNSTLVGYAVNQEGRVSATTSVATNGSIRLLARDSAEADLTVFKFQATRTGSLTLGSQSETSVVPELEDAQTAVDAQTQYPSYVEAMGHQVTFKSGSTTRVNGGRIDVSAVRDPRLSALSATSVKDGKVLHPEETTAGVADPESQLRIETGATIDLSGSDATLPMSRNLLTVELRSSELADSPNQRDSAIRGRPLAIDARRGTPLGNIDGALAAVGRNIGERTSTGGTAVFVSDGDIVAASGSELIVSGGIVNYEGGVLQTSRLIGADGKIYDVGSADPNRTYVGVINPTYRRVDDKWGQVSLTPLQNFGSYEAGYVEGKSAGTVQFVAPTLVLNGNLIGASVSGPFQRTPSTTPSGGTLLLGLTQAIKSPLGDQNDYGAPSVNFVRNPPTIVVGAGASVSTLQALALPTGYLSNGFTRTRIFSNGTIKLGENTPLLLTPGSLFELSGDRINIDSSIQAFGGSLNFASRETYRPNTDPASLPAIAIGSGVTFDVRGQWVNDSLLKPGVRPVETMFIDGGSIDISLNATFRASELVIGDDVQMLADGGAQVALSGRVTPGAGGDIGIRADASNATGAPTLDIGDGLHLQAHGVLGADGGSLVLKAPAIQIVQDEIAVRSQTFDAAEDNFLRVGSGIFSNYGFASFELAAGLTRDSSTTIVTDAMQVERNTSINVQVKSITLHENAGQQRSGGTVEGFSSIVLPEAFLRQSATVDLRAKLYSYGGGSSRNAGNFSIGEGAAFNADPGSSFVFSSVGSLAIFGTINAPGGTISASIDSPEPSYDDGFRADQQLRIGGRAQLNVGGYSTYTPNDLGALRGTVGDGGTIELLASRGSVVLSTGSILDVSGIAAPLDLSIGGGEARTYVRQTVTSNGGSIAIAAREDIDLSGQLRAFSGSGGDSSAAGSLSLQLLRGAPASNIADTFPATQRVIRLSPQDSAATANLDDGVVGLGVDFIRRSGFDSVALKVFDEVGSDGGRVELATGLKLSLARQISIDASQIAMSDGGIAALTANYITIGNSSDRDSRSVNQAGNGLLQLNADFIDIVGSSAISGVHLATFTSNQDIRLRGTSRAGGAISGNLDSAGDLRFNAARMYGSTLTQFTVRANGGVSDRIQVLQRGQANGTPLSVGASLTFIASEIEQGGTLLAPYGSITLDASNSVALLDGSLTSVSGSGNIFPFGSVSNGAWSYGTGRTSIAFESLATPRVALDGAIVYTGPKAVVDLSGGGDLYAYEWVPGTGGSRDALSNKNSQAFGMFAILPSLRDTFAPYDPQEYGSDPFRADSVYLSGYGQLSAGIYPLLPARYALLPGAYLVNPVAGVVDLAPGSAARMLDGTPVIAGYRTYGTTAIGGNRYAGFAIRPGNFGRILAQYDDFYASSFLNARAERLELSRPRSPLDAGLLSLFANDRLDLQGAVKTRPANGGIGATIEISALRLAVTSSGSDGDANTVDIGADKISAWNPSRLLLGARRDASGALGVTADEVVMKDGAILTLDEVAIAAQDRIELQGTSTVASRSGMNQNTVQLSSNAGEISFANPASQGAALLAVSDLQEWTRARSSSSGTGSIAIDPTSTIASRGAITVSAPAGGEVNGSIRASNAHTTIGADELIFGEASTNGTLTINQVLQNQLQMSEQLNLDANRSLQFSRDTTLALNSAQSTLRLQSPSVMATAGVEVNIAATTVGISGGAASANGPSAGSSTFGIAAESIELGQGAFEVSGFSQSTWEATRQVIGTDSGQVVVSGDLSIHSPAIAVATGVDTKVESKGGDVILEKATAAGALLGSGLGGSLTIKAHDIQDSLAIVAPSGVVSFEATGDLQFLDGAIIDVSGRQVTAGGRQLGSAGGAVRLSSEGALNIAAGSAINLDSEQGSSAGRLFIRSRGAATLNGELSAHGSADGLGGSIAIDAASIENFVSLNTRLQAGGFSESQHIHVDAGDLALAVGSNVGARSVSWTSDTGSILVAGSMRANSDDIRGSIQLYGGSVALASTAELNTDALNGAARGGDIEIGASIGSLEIANASSLSAAGARANGVLTLRAPTVGNTVAITSMATDLSGLSRVIIAPIIKRDILSATVTASDLSAARGAATTFVNTSGATIGNGFAASQGAPIVVRPDVELRRNGDLSLGTLDLGAWRFGGEPGALTVRATGSVTLSGTISDGFDIVASRVAPKPGESSTIRIAAGADLSSANPNSVDASAASSLTFAPNTVLRTGTGSLSLNSAGNITFNTGATAYTGGLPGSPTQTISNIALSGNLVISFPDLGGTLSVNAGGDIFGSAIQQSVTTWQYRGARSSANQPLPRLWGVNATNFRWNLGALGGGDVLINASGDIADLSAASADSALVDNADTVKVLGGGSISINAGGDIATGDFFGARGLLSVLADGSLTSIRPLAEADPVGTLIWMGDTHATIRARKDLLLETLANPTTLPIPGLRSTARASYFSNYSQRSAIDLESTAGRIVLQNQKERTSSFLELSVFQDATAEAFALFPGSLTARAFSNDIALNGLATLYPVVDGQLDLFAARDITALNGGFRMSDVDATTLSSIVNPSTATIFLTDLAKSALASIHRDDTQPVVISAGHDISGATFSLAKAGRITADRDIADLTLNGQNLRDEDLTLLLAGRDVIYHPDDPTHQSREISLGGPGRLDILAGRNVDLGATSGVTTTGRLLNATIPSSRGADITIMAGLGARPDYAGFLDRIVVGSDSYATDVVDYIKQLMHKDVDFDGALSELRKLSAEQQRPLLDKIFFSELVKSGREANTIPDAGFKRGYLAIDALFPGSRDVGTSPYDGNLNMSFSRIYTLAGGDISLLIPGGLLNVGLANPPASILSRTADKLGIVAQREGAVKIFSDQDVLVNKSRVFTLLGGDIAVWSTRGNIDAGRGAKSALSAPPPRVQITADGKVSLDFSGAVTGSGIRGIVTADNVTPGDVDLMAPVGFVNAGDAGIGSAGNLNIAAQTVIGLDNIQVGGASTGVPAETSGLGASLSGVAATGSSATNASGNAVNNDTQAKEAAAPLAASALSWLDVFVIGLGEDACKQDDIECLKRQK
jgi:filamentous hemagglutinin family protein